MTEQTENYKTIYQRAIIKFGVDSQMGKLLEEMSELAVAIYHERDGKSDNIAEEFADVEIMLEQLRPLFNENNEIDNWKKMKIERLAKRVG